MLVRVFFGYLKYFTAFLQIRGDGLFHKHMVPQLKGWYSVAHMLPVHSGYNSNISELALCKHLLGAGKAVFFGNIIELLSLFYLVRV